MVEQVLIHCFPGLSSEIPGHERMVDFEEDRMGILDDTPLETRSPPGYELLVNEFLRNSVSRLSSSSSSSDNLLRS